MDVNEMTRKLVLHTPTILGGESFAKFAVFLPLVKKEDGISLPLNSQRIL